MPDTTAEQVAKIRADVDAGRAAALAALAKSCPDMLAALTNRPKRMTHDEATKYHMARVDSGDMVFHHRVGNRQEAMLRAIKPRQRPAMLDETWRAAVEAEAAVS